jgi:hypothetical protein
MRSLMCKVEFFFCKNNVIQLKQNRNILRNNGDQNI